MVDYLICSQESLASEFSLQFRYTSKQPYNIKGENWPFEGYLSLYNAKFSVPTDTKSVRSSFKIYNFNF